jgi:predicted permease
MMSAKSIYRALLYVYPAAFRDEFGGQMLAMFSQQLNDAVSLPKRTVLWTRAALDAITVAPQEHFHVIIQDLRYAIRMMAARPGFAAVAILSLALGIGANTAIFSLWNGILNSPLPAVSHPEQLVILTNPDRSGMWHGSMTFRGDGYRAWLTYAEFGELRDHADLFSSLMASGSFLDSWQVRYASGEPEKVSGRWVSGGFFSTLGVHAASGRLFTPDDDRAVSPIAVISYSYWQRRFGGQPVTGNPIAFRNVTVNIIGVAARGFIGENHGQNPDLWLPLQLQPVMTPKNNFLRDVPPTKVMWLHAFGRLKPGVTLAQANAQANAIFQGGLPSFYGSVPEDKRAEYLDQRLQLTAAARGASDSRKEFSGSLKVLLAAVGVLLLIGCANLANLLLARGAARKTEIALRLSLGASRGRIIRQLVTESLLLGVIGGAAGLVLAGFLHSGLVWLMAQSDPVFDMRFSLDPIVLAFAAAVTLAAILLVSVLPAFEATRTGAGLYQHSRGLAREKRWARYLVSVQLALSLPLLAGAGLLMRTLYNLEHVDLGFAKDHLLMLRVDSRDAGYDGARRAALHRQLAADLTRIPGVRAVTFSQLGIFTGGDSGNEIEVEGYAGKGNQSHEDSVSAQYFSTLGAPILLGRDIQASDRAGATNVCVINEAFAARYFAGRNPIGMHVTMIADDSARQPLQIAGVAKNIRTHANEIRDAVQPRFFTPADQFAGEQFAGDMPSPTFLIRTTTATAPVAAAARKMIERLDPSLPIDSAESLDERMAPMMAEDAAIAQLATGFAAVALALAAIGLYGVLSYGIARRTREIAVRIAIGARPGRVISMILKETASLIAAGLVIGAGLAYASSRFIGNRLFGVAAADPWTLSLACALLVSIGFLAAYLPARQASKLDPMSALRQE